MLQLHWVFRCLLCLPVCTWTQKTFRTLMDKPLGWVFNSRLRRACIWLAIAWITKRPNLKLKTQPEQLLGSLPISFMLPGTLQQPVHGIKLTRTFFLIPLMVIRWLLNDSNIVWPVENDLKLFSCIHMGTKLAIQVQEVDLKKTFFVLVYSLYLKVDLLTEHLWNLQKNVREFKALLAYFRLA